MSKNNIIYILSSLLFVTILVSIYLSFFRPRQVFCPADAMLCPDGSYVSRTGPNCEFAPCPSSTDDGCIPANQTGDMTKGQQCCPGLTSVLYPCNGNPPDCTCSLGGPAIHCTDCGNDTCDQFESVCNCPQDCDSTSSWQTYTNPTYGFEFKYPKNWLVEASDLNDKDSSQIVTIKGNKTRQSGQSNADIVFLIHNNFKSLSLEEFDEQRKHQEEIYQEPIPLYNPNAEKIAIGKVTIYYDSGSFCEPVICGRAVIPYTDKILEVLDFENYEEETFTKILSTFRFLD